MRHIFKLAPALILTAAAFAPAASAKTCSKICNNPAAHIQPIAQPVVRTVAQPIRYAAAQPRYKGADHSHVTIYNGVQHGLSAGRAHNGVRVLTPSPLYNAQQQANLAASLDRAEQAATALKLAYAQAELSAARQAESAARLSAIEAKQDLILERQSRSAQPRRRVYYGNNRFFGRNGFIGNSNFSGATVAANRKRRRRAKH